MKFFVISKLTIIISKYSLTLINIRNLCILLFKLKYYCIIILYFSNILSINKNFSLYIEISVIISAFIVFANTILNFFFELYI